jgi:hypothetical protein
MKCDDFKDKCGDLSDGEVSAEMRMHMAHCEECAAYYRLMRSLEPKAVPVAPGTLKREVLARAAAKHRKRPAVAVRRIGCRGSVDGRIDRSFGSNGFSGTVEQFAARDG